MAKRIAYAAIVDQVLEIGLRGSADLAPWQALLARERVSVVGQDGRAQLLVSATSARFKGIPFRELCILVAVTAEVSGREVAGFFLPRAFNSNGWFAWIERTMFSCPYLAARVEVAAEPALAFRVDDAKGGSITASRAASQRGEGKPDGWQGPVFLPRTRVEPFFYVQLSGETEYEPFAGDDAFAMSGASVDPAIRCLSESDFRPAEWFVRRSAVHAKSKTLERSRCTIEMLAREREAGFVGKQLASRR